MEAKRKDDTLCFFLFGVGVESGQRKRVTSTRFMCSSEFCMKCTHTNIYTHTNVIVFTLKGFLGGGG